MRTFLITLGLLLNFGAARAEEPATVTAPAPPPQAIVGNQIRPLGVLPSTDTSSFNLGANLQNAMMTLFSQMQYYKVQVLNTPLAGFTEPEVARVRALTGMEILSFAYLEQERISLFLFDKAKPKEFLVVTQGLIDPMLGNVVTPQVIEYKFKMAFNQLVNAYYKGEFQPLPGSSPAAAAADADSPQRRAEESRRLFRELTALQDNRWYLGATIGMARYAGGPGSASSVDFGAFGGSRFGERFRGEMGFNFFAYSLLHFDFGYHMPFAEKYVSLYLLGSFGTVLGVITGPRFDNEAKLSGGLMYGPGISFDIPLLGANIRGEIKIYVGSGSILFGSYGISYAI